MLLDLLFGSLGGAPERPESGVIGAEVDRVVFPQPGGDHAAVEIDDAAEFNSFKTDLGGLTLPARERVDGAHQARSRSRSPRARDPRVRLGALAPSRSSINSATRLFNRSTSRSEEHTSELQSLMRISY